MTCIVGLVEKGKVYIGADSLGSNGYSKSVRKDSKVFKNGKFVIGCTTSFRMIQLLQFSFKPPKIKGEELFKYMCTSFVDEVQKVFESNGWDKKETDGERTGGTFMIGVNGRLFTIYNDFQVAENSLNYNSIGCGESYAKGSLFSTNGSPKERITKALESAEQFSTGVGKPFKIMSI